MHNRRIWHYVTQRYVGQAEQTPPAAAEGALLAGCCCWSRAASGHRAALCAEGAGDWQAPVRRLACPRPAQ